MDEIRSISHEEFNTLDEPESLNRTGWYFNLNLHFPAMHHEQNYRLSIRLLNHMQVAIRVNVDNKVALRANVNNLPHKGADVRKIIDFNPYEYMNDDNNNIVFKNDISEFKVELQYGGICMKNGGKVGEPHSYNPAHLFSKDDLKKLVGTSWLSWLEMAIRGYNEEYIQYLTNKLTVILQ